VILTGNICTGKSYYAKQEKEKNPENIEIVTPDEISKYKFTNEEIWNEIYFLIDKYLKENETVIFDGSCMSRKIRDNYCYFAKKNKAKSIVMDFGPGDEKTLEKCIKERPQISPEIWKKSHKEYQAEYEKPDLEKEPYFDEIIDMTKK